MTISLNKQEIGRRIEVLRQNKGLSQRELARQTKIAQSAISDLEHGKRLPSTKVLEKLMQFFEISAADLIGPAESNPEDSKKMFMLRLITERLASLNAEELAFIKQMIDRVAVIRNMPETKH